MHPSQAPSASLATHGNGSQLFGWHDRSTRGVNGQRWRSAPNGCLTSLVIRSTTPPCPADHAKRADGEQQKGGVLGHGRGEEAVFAGVSIAVASHDLPRVVDRRGNRPGPARWPTTAYTRSATCKLSPGLSSGLLWAS